ncbi:uncharacterized skeletal organic matrix protein 2-like [Boleophthalmus pectinirostris]|uniref:uncharacterized skeletal organic matrix protein 2-like n=1 Tax=Boleophthalmus pectinirostris TaxID=150288 RepID=UPI00242E929D|nr:uncharacterized skeletal organic matrix protein 2-like [Boleophthalmus pectinirostris]
MSGSGSSQRLVNCSFQTTACYSRSYTGSYDYGDYSYTYNYTYKGCASASDCTAAGSEFVSYNYGPNTYAVNTTCCDTDNCNENHSIVAPPVGSLQCYSCDPYSYECTANVTCNTQEVCGQAVVDQYNPSRPFYGCVSENLCNNITLSRRYFGFSTSVSCCNTSHCNIPDLGLQCSTCTDSSCSSQRSVTCSKLAPFCYTDAYAGSYDYGSSSSSYSVIRKGCASSSVCTAAGSEFDSYDYGSSSYLKNKTCCDTDDCNAPNPTSPPVGSLQCYSCDPDSYECTANVCVSDISSYNYGDNSYTYNYTYKGCASASDCTAAGSEFVSYNYGPNTYAVNTTCCDTDNCNENHSIVAPPVGSLQCYSCDPYSYECTANVTCNTQEVCGQAVAERPDLHFTCSDECRDELNAALSAF